MLGKKKDDSTNHWPAVSDLMLGLVLLFIALWGSAEIRSKNEIEENKKAAKNEAAFRCEIVKRNNDIAEFVKKRQWPVDVGECAILDPDSESTEITPAITTSINVLKKLANDQDDLTRKMNERINILEDTIKKLEAEVDRLNAKNQEFQAEVERLKAVIQHLTTEIDRLNADKEQPKTKPNPEVRIKDLIARIKELEEKIKELEAQVKNLKEDQLPFIPIEGDVVFEVGKDALRNENLKKLYTKFSELSAAVQKHGVKVTDIMIVGFTDKQGDDNFNADLGLRRAIKIAGEWEKWVKSQVPDLQIRQKLLDKKVHTFSAGESEAKNEDNQSERKINIYLMGIKN